MSPSISSLLGFVAIVALIPVALWLLKRTPIGGGAAHGVMRTVAMLPISTNQRLLTVEVGNGDDKKWLVLGVTPSGITTLHTMAPQAIEPVSTPLQPFAQLLAKHLPGARNGSADAR
ncbi:MAG TPA: flagellar biosynthetic protein FliO [Burkholderiaceae bacterium]